MSERNKIIAEMNKYQNESIYYLERKFRLDMEDGKPVMKEVG